MLDAKQLKRDILNDLRVDLSEEFDLNFRRKAFFSERWKPRAHPYPRGSLLIVSSALRRSILENARTVRDGVRFSSAMAYASIHNEGGAIAVTPKMKRFFWHKFRQTGDESWKRMALMKVGKIITIPERRFVGDGPDTQRIIRTVIEDNLQKFNISLTNFLRQ